MDADRLAMLPGAALARLYLGGQADPVAVTEAVFERIERLGDPAVFITLTPDRARREAEASARRYREGRPLGPLDGVPLAWKDLVDLAGTPTTAGSALLRAAPPAAADAPIAAAAAAAGLVSIGKTNLTEFAFSALGLNPHFGTPRNPHGGAEPRVPGGSSSGSAVAVAAGIVPIAIGSDTGGSVRIPAAFCGTVGYKTSWGRVPSEGVFMLAPSLDTIGPLARSVEDCVLIDAAMRGLAVPGIRRADPASIRLLVPETVVLDGAEPEVIANFERSIAALERAGVTIRRAAFPVFDEIIETIRRHGTLATAEALAEHEARLDGPERAQIDPRVVQRIELGRKMTALDLIRIQRARRRLAAAAAEVLDGALLAFPTLPFTAPPVAPLEADVERFHATNIATLRNTMLGNFLGQCGLALPNGTGRDGLPTSFALHAPGDADERLLAAGLAIEPVLRGA